MTPSSAGRSHVIAVAGDAGGAVAVAPVVSALRADGRADVTAAAYRQAIGIWWDRGLAPEELSETLDTSSIRRRLGAHVDLLICGASANGIDLEKQFIAAARHMAIPSLTVLDTWSWHAMRWFTTEDGQVVLPDRIAAPDERMMARMIGDGIPAERVVVTGHPGLDDLAEFAARAPERRAALRRELGIDDSELLILFASQPLREFWGADPSAPGHPGYTETTVLDALLPALARVSERSGIRPVLLIRPHPRDDTRPSVPVGPLRVLVSRSGAARDAIAAADVVTGMSTMLLVESALLGRPTISIQPGLRRPDFLPTNIDGTSRAVYDVAEIEPALAEEVERARRSGATGIAVSDRLVPGATRRVVELVYAMLGAGSGRAE